MTDAQAARQLFNLPLKPSGSVTCTEPATRVYLLTLTSPPDNRLTTAVCHALLLALDIIECRQPPGVVISTSGIQKFYSNGLELERATSTVGFLERILYPLFRRFLTYPMPTVALINGHAFAGGLMLAMHHDYRLFNPSRGFLCINELDFGVSLKPPMSSIFRQKLPSPATYRDLVLEARRYAGPDALREGIVDALGGLDEALALVRARDLTKKGASGVYGAMKGEMWRESIAYLDDHSGNETRTSSTAETELRLKEDAARRVAIWQESQNKSRL